MLPPLYVAVTGTRCWKCDAEMKVAALIAPNVVDAPGEVLVLQGVCDLPNPILLFVQARVPHYRLGYSRTIESEYFANHCPLCGAITGDFYLFSEPGGPFWPETADAAAAIRVAECPLAGPIVLETGYGRGLGGFILEHASRSEEPNG